MSSDTFEVLARLEKDIEGPWIPESLKADLRKLLDALEAVKAERDANWNVFKIEFKGAYETEQKLAAAKELLRESLKWIGPHDSKDAADLWHSIDAFVNEPPG